MKPGILIDVDGVLNAFVQPPSHGIGYCKCHPGWIRRRFTARNGVRYKINLYPRHGRMLLNLAAECDAELFWATTWEDDANTDIGPYVGLPVLPVIPCPIRPRNFTMGGYGAWKAIHVAQWANAQQTADHVGRPFVWFDDESDAPDALAKLTTVPHLVITVNDTKGLTDDDVNRARTWLQENSRL